MKYTTAIVGVVALCVSEVGAFPAAAINYAAKAERDAHTNEALGNIRSRFERSRRAPGFNATEQYVSNQGAHAFRPPIDVNTPTGDQRGPCPGLNAMANHGYLPHNGVASISQFIDGTYRAFGMGNDLAGFLAVYGALFDGDGTKWSIGGPTVDVPATLGLLGQPEGISGSHNRYECDVSATRPDLTQYGNDYKVVMSQFKQLYDMQPDAATANYDLSVLTPFRAARFQQSIENNPYFFNGLFTGVLVQPAGYCFIYRFMSNKSAEYPEGRLDQETLKSFFSITGDEDNFVWTEGYEKIPDNWYKRAIGDDYTLPFLISDIFEAGTQYPQFVDVGGNTGTVNSFTGVDVKNLTGGVYNGATLLEGDNLVCFVFQGLEQQAPDILGSLLTSVTAPMAKLTQGISDILTTYNCPKLQKIDESQFSKFPGAKGSY